MLLSNRQRKIASLVDALLELPRYPWLEEDQQIIAENSLRGLKRHQVADRPQFKTMPLLAVVYWLLRPNTRWRSYILDDTDRSAVSRGIFFVLAYQLSKHRYTQSQRSAVALIARRLMWISGIGVNVASRNSIAILLSGHGVWRVPRPGVAAPAGASWRHRGAVFRNCHRSTAMGLVETSIHFLAGHHIYRCPVDTEQMDTADDRNLGFSLSFYGERIGFGIDQVRADEQPAAQKSPLANIHAVNAAVTSFLAPDPRGLLVASHILEAARNENRIFSRKFPIPEGRMRNRSVRLLAGAISVLTGTPLEEVVNIALHPPETLESGFASFRNSGIEDARKIIGFIVSWDEAGKLHLPRFNLGSDNDPFFLVIFVGPSRNTGFSSRIADQFIVAPLPCLAQLIEQARGACGNWQNPTFASVVQDCSLSKIRYGLVKSVSNPFGNVPWHWHHRTFQRFTSSPHSGFVYAAAVECGIPPPILSLMIGRPFGPWRASLNYACVSAETIASAFANVQSVLFGAKGMHRSGKPVFSKNYSVGAGLLQNRQIGPAGIPPISDLMIAGGGHSKTTGWLAVKAAGADRLIRVFGRRYMSILSNPANELIDQLEIFQFKDKNLAGKVFPRLLPLPAELRRYISESGWAAGPRQIKIRGPAEGEVERLRTFAGDRNGGRKAFYSHCLQRGFGDEMISFLFGHGFTLTKSLGPISPVPWSWFVSQAQSVVDQTAEDSQLHEAISRLESPTRRQLKRANSMQSAKEAGNREAPSWGELPDAIQHLPIPSAHELQFLKSLMDAIVSSWADFRIHPEKLKKIFFLLLILGGLPLNHVKSYIRYVRGNSVIRCKTNGSTAYFVIFPIPQQDLGLGLVPLRLSDRIGRLLFLTLRCIYVNERRSAVIAKEKSRFDTRIVFRGINRSKYEEIVRFARSLGRNESGLQAASWVRAALNSGSKFLARARFGGLIFGSLSGRGVTPCNFYEIQDLFYQAFGESVVLETVTGSAWENSFRPSPTDIAAYRSHKRGTRPGGRGRPSSARTPTKGLQSIHDLTRYYHGVFQTPSATLIRDSMDRLGVYTSRASEAEEYPRSRRSSLASARLIMRSLRERGNLFTGGAEHMLWPQHSLHFLDKLNEILTRVATIEERQAALWWVTLVLLIGCRPNEAPLISESHIDDPKAPVIVRIEGRKTTAAPRTLHLSLFTSDPTGAALLEKFLKLGNGRWTFANRRIFSNGDAFQRKVNNWIAQAFGTLRSELCMPPADHTFSLYSLRHACAFRVVQQAIDRSLWKGTFWIQVASVSQALGHKSMVTTLSSYLGTAMLCLEWPSLQDGEDSYSPLRSPLLEPLERG